MISAAVSHFRTTFLLFLLILIGGAYSYINIPKESAPDVPIPTIYVSITYEGISPEDAVNLLLKPMENELRGLEGLDEMESTAYEGGANIVLNFQAGFDNDQALIDVREKVDAAKAELPDEADEPQVVEINISLFPVLTVLLSGDVPERELKNIAEDLQDRIESLPTVLEAPIQGIREQQVLLEVDRAKLESFQLDPQLLIQQIGANNQLVAAGSLEIDEGRYAVKVPGLFRSLDEILNLPLITDGTRDVRIQDVANVKLNFKDATTRAQINGQTAVSLDVSKQIGENIIETVDAVKAIVREESQAWPATLTYEFTNDESEQTRTQVLDLQNNVMIAVLLVMVVILAALGPRSAILVATTIPGAFLTGIMMLFVFGFTTNVVVLFALILSVGLLVDGAVVVTELADTKLAKGMRRTDAFVQAAQEMSWPIIASTATTLAAFLPLLFWPGTVGEFMKFMPLTLIFTLTASLAMALVFLPTIGAAFPRPPAVDQPKQPFYVAPYEKILRRALRHPWKVLGLVFLAFISSIATYSIFGNGIQYFPEIEPERAQLVIHARGDYSMAEQQEIVQKVDTAVRDLPGIQTFYTIAGNPDAQREGPSDVVGKITLEYIDWADGRPTSKEILNEALARTQNIYGIRVEEVEAEEGPGGGKPIQIAVSAPRFDMLPPIINQIQAQLEAFAGTINVDNNLPEPGIEWALNIDRAEAARAGTNLTTIGAMVRLATNGAIVGTYRPLEDDDEIDIVARFPQADRTLDVIDTLTIPIINNREEGADRVPLSHFMEREAQPKVTVIRRLDQNDTVYIEADVAEGILPNEVVTYMREQVAKAYENGTIPNNIRVQFKGEDEDQAEASQFLMKAFIVAIFIMTIILVTQFNSFYQAFIILIAIVLSTTGVLLGHLIMGKPFGIIMSGLGVISLAGIVVNNNIVLIDQYNKLIKQMDWYDAIIETGKRRLRPVLLTAITTIVGLMPMGLKLNLDVVNRTTSYNAPSSQWWDQLANSIMFGLAFATILTLIVTPCLLALGARRKDKKRSKKETPLAQSKKQAMLSETALEDML